MKFNEAFEAMKQGAKIKLPGWAGFWDWEEDTIMMHCKDGKVLDIRETENPEYTFGNIASEEWIIADETNTPIMGGVALFSFSDAIRYVKRGLKVSRKLWDSKERYIFMVSNFTCNINCMNRDGDVINFSYETFPKETIAQTTHNNVCGYFEPSPNDMLSDDWYIVD